MFPPAFFHACGLFLPCFFLGFLVCLGLHLELDCCSLASCPADLFSRFLVFDGVLSIPFQDPFGLFLSTNPFFRRVCFLGFLLGVRVIVFVVSIVASVSVRVGVNAMGWWCRSHAILLVYGDS